MQREPHLLLTEKVPDLNTLVSIGDGGIDWKVGIHEPHFRSVSFGDTGDQILNVAKGSTDRDAGLARAKPGFYLPLPRLILHELEIQVQMLEIPTKLASQILLLFFFVKFCFNFSFYSLFSFMGAMMIYVEAFRDLFPY